MPFLLACFKGHPSNRIPRNRSARDAVQDNSEACDLGTALNDGSYGGCNDDCPRAPFCGETTHVDEPHEACDLGDGAQHGSYGDVVTMIAHAPPARDAHVDELHEACDQGDKLNDGSYGGCNDDCSRARAPSAGRTHR